MDSTDVAVQRSNPLARLPQVQILPGEAALLVSKTVEGDALVTNYRFCVYEKRSFFSLSLLMVGDLAVIEAARHLRVMCKDGATYTCTFATTEDCSACVALLKARTGLPRSKDDLFAYKFYESVMKKKESGDPLSKQDETYIALCSPVSSAFAYSFGKEVERLGFDTSKRKLWRMSQANENYEFCPTYPKFHILPAAVEDDKLKISLDFRAMKRFPSVVWRDRRSGMVLIRSSQPLSSFLGVSYFTNYADVSLIDEIVKACNEDWSHIMKQLERRANQSEANGQISLSGNHNPKTGVQVSLSNGSVHASNGHLEAEEKNGFLDAHHAPKKLAIVDCRSLAGVWGNSFKGGGTEDEVIYKCSTVHLDLANIHTVRDSFNKLRSLCYAYPEGTFHKNLASSMWLPYLSALLRGANIVVELMNVMVRPVLVHCSDGWDRTSQIVSLSELMMDSYYRTLTGFQVLVEREWLHFGYKFGERGGHDPACSDSSQISPVFLQFLDCVYQLTLQYPAEFQFSEAYLVKLGQHSLSGLFGTFLHNCQREREAVSGKTASVWSFLNSDRQQFVNLLYRPTDQVLKAKIGEPDIVLWKSVYMAGLSTTTHVSPPGLHPHASYGKTISGGEQGQVLTEGMPKSKSMDDLSKIGIEAGHHRNRELGLTLNPESAHDSPTTTSTQEESSLKEHLQCLEEPPKLHSPDQPEKPNEASAENVCLLVTAADQEDKSPNVNGNVSPAAVFSDGIEENISSAVASVELLPEKTLLQNKHGESKYRREAYDVSRGEAYDVSRREAYDVSRREAYDVSRREASSVSESMEEALLSDHCVAESLNPTSSAVFCQASTSQLACGHQHRSCNGSVDAGEPQKVSSHPTNVEDSDLVNGCDIRNVENCNKLIRTLTPGDSFMPCSSPVSSNRSPSDYHVYCQTSLLSERLAISSGDLEFVNGGQSSNYMAGAAKVKVSKNSTDSCQQPLKSKSLVDLRSPFSYQAVGNSFKPGVGSNHHLGEEGNGDNSVFRDILGEDEINLDNNVCDLPNSSCISTKAVGSAYMLSEQKDVKLGSDDLIFTTSRSCSKPVKMQEYSGQMCVMATSVSPPSSALMSSSVKRTSCLADVPDFLVSMARRSRDASGASREISILSCACRGNWSDVGRLRHPSGSELSFRRQLGASVATSTTDISDSHVGLSQLLPTLSNRLPDVVEHVDDDGLALFHDERQNLVGQLLAEKDRVIRDLKQQLSYAHSSRGRIAQPAQVQAALPNDFTADINGEVGSLGAISNASDTSWETLEESDARLIMWVPDSVVTHCAGCDTQFTIVRRKHHCRNCGKVFCASCSSYQAPVPHQHLNTPERVCQRCHSHLLQLSPGASSDGRIPTLVADG